MPGPADGNVTFERRRWRFGVTWKEGFVCPADIGGAGFGGAAAMGTTLALMPLVEGEKVVGVVAVGPLLVDPWSDCGEAELLSLMAWAELGVVTGV